MAIAEVAEDAAQGKVKAIYADIKDSLRTPVIAPIFAALAAYPDYLQIAWTALKPNVQTMYFETCADSLRSLAAAGASGDRPATPDGVQPVLQVFQYLGPKLLLAVGALQSATSGQQPRLQELGRDEKRQIAPGIPQGAPTIQMVGPESATEPVAATQREIDGTLGYDALGEYRSLAAWPEYLTAVREMVGSTASGPPFGAKVRSLRSAVEEAVAALPYRMDISPHVLRHAGLSEADLDGVQSILNAAYRSLPVRVLVLSALSGTGTSPFPAQTI